MSDYLEALQARGDALERFYDCQRQANEWIAANGTQPLVDELRLARDNRRPVRMGTINTLILLAHLDRLEAELAKEPLVKP